MKQFQSRISVYLCIFLLIQELFLQPCEQCSMCLILDAYIKDDKGVNCHQSLKHECIEPQVPKFQILSIPLVYST